MRKTLIFLFAVGLSLVSCDDKNGIDIVRRLSDEDAKIVPYQLEQTVKFLNTITNDTLTMTVIDDEIAAKELGEEQEYTKMHVNYNDKPCDYSYCRYITLADENNMYKMFYIVRPDKKFDFVFKNYGEETRISVDFDLNEIALTPATTIEGVDYANVYINNLPGGGKVVFSTEKGLIVLKTAYYSYLLID